MELLSRGEKTRVTLSRGQPPASSVSRGATRRCSGQAPPRGGLAEVPEPQLDWATADGPLYPCYHWTNSSPRACGEHVSEGGEVTPSQLLLGQPWAHGAMVQWLIPTISMALRNVSSS